MRKTIGKVLIILIFMILLNLILTKDVSAMSATLSASECSVGESFTVRCNLSSDVYGYTYNVQVTFSDGSVKTASASGIVGMEDHTSVSIKADVAGSATVAITSYTLVDSNENVVNSSSPLTQSINIAGGSSAPEPDTSTPEPSSPEPSTPAPEPDPTPTLSFTDTNETMYTIQRVNVRQSYGTNAGIIQTLPIGTEVTRLGLSQGTANGYSWSKVSYNGVTGYLITGSLDYTNPNPKNEEQPPEEQTNPEEQPPEENPEATQDEIAKLKEKFGTFPEVGVNIMPFIFLGSCVSCIAIMIEMKRKA